MRDGIESGKPHASAQASSQPHAPASPLTSLLGSDSAFAAPNHPIPMLDLSREYSRIGPELLAAVEQVLTAQNFVLGHQVSEFEDSSAAFCRANHAIGCSSGTDALWLSLAAAQIGPGDAVVTTPFSFFATASSIYRAGARPLFADIDPRTFNLNPAAADALLQLDRNTVALHHQTTGSLIKAILPVHLYGQPADWDSFRALKEKYGVLLIEDAAQAFGAAWDGVPAGALGDLAAFSFYPTKNLSASGDAGLVTTGDPALAERLRMLRSHGMRQRYYHDELGWNCRLDTLQAAMLLVKMKYIAAWNERRRTLAANYNRLFAATGLVESSGPYPTHGVVLPWTHPRATHVFHQYVLRVPRRNALLAFLEARRIGAEVYYPVPLHLQRSLADLGYRRGDFPESERAADEVLALPIYPELRYEEQQIVVAAIAAFLS